MKYRKKPVVIEAEQWNKDWKHPIVEPFADMGIGWNYGLCKQCGESYEYHGKVKTLEGDMTVCPGDWIITGIKGEYYPCKPDIFEKTYEEVKED